jgi:hypothetical protein
MTPEQGAPAVLLRLHSWPCIYPPLAYVRDVVRRLHTVVETPEFVAAARGALAETERAELIDYLAATPTAGDLMPGTGGGRKLRWALKARAGGAAHGSSLTTLVRTYRFF